MGVGQLWLFEPPKPLVERFGDEFFAALPTGPGVYFFCGASEGVLYVGKARNLRKRLRSYRVANPERLSRRIVRLLHQVRRIEWDECPTEEAARNREELLICVLAPKFNAAGKVWERRNGKPSWFERERAKCGKEEGRMKKGKNVEGRGSCLLNAELGTRNAELGMRTGELGRSNVLWP